MRLGQWPRSRPGGSPPGGASDGAPSLGGRGRLQEICRWSGRPAVALAVVLAVALALRLPNFNESLWFDELWATRIKLGSFYQLLRIAATDVHPPFYSGFMFLWIKLFGDSEISVRLPPLLFGLAAIAMTYLLCSRFIGQGPALLAAALAAVSPAHIWYSQEARQYSALIFLVALGIYSYVKATEHQDRSRWWTAYAGASLTAVFTAFFAVAYVAATSLLSLRYRDRRTVRTLGINLGVVVALGAYLGLKAAVAGQDTSLVYLREFRPFELWMLLFNWFPTGNAVWPVSGWSDDFGILLRRPWMFLTQALLAVGLVSLVQKYRRSSDLAPLEFITLFLALPVLMFLLSIVGFGQIFIERSMLVMLPLFYGVLAFGLFSIPFMAARLSLGLALAALCVTSLVVFYDKHSTEWTIYKPNPDWRSTASYLAREMEAVGGRPVVLGSTPAEVLSYYDGRFQRWRPQGPSQTGSGGFRDIAQRLFGGENPAEDAGYGEVSPFPVVYLTDLERATGPEFPPGAGPVTLYLLHNLFWADGFDALKARVEATGGFRLQAVHEERGIVVYKFAPG